MDVTALRAPARGFSLLELATSLLIAITLLGVGVPAWQQLSDRNAISNSRTLLMGAMALARQSAIDSGYYITLCPSNENQLCSGDYTDWHSGAILFVDDNANRQLDSGERLVRTIGAQPRVVIQSSSGRRSIRYSPDGSAWGSNLTLRFCLPDGTPLNRAIILYGSGRARLSPTLSNGDPITCI